MTEVDKIPDNNTGFPTAPANLPVRIWRRIMEFLASVKLAMVLLITILVCCIIGAAVIPEDKAGALVFNTLWFNGLLVVLVLNVAFCFFSRTWGRKVTLISLGMIMFHLSFVAMLGGIIYNSMFYFEGDIRLTEGETLPSGQLQSYDFTEQGRFFNLSWLKGETALQKVFREYKVDGIDKRWSYQIAVGDGRSQKQGIIYVTESLSHNGFTYYNAVEGYSILTLLYDKNGREIYGAHVPLQSLKQKDDSYLYSTGTRIAPGILPFPQDPQNPLFNLQAIYHPSKLDERGGDITFKIWQLVDPDKKQKEEPIAEVKGQVGKKLKVGDYYITASEVRYWAVMIVRFEPGKPIVLASLWVGLAGMVITFFGRMRRGSVLETAISLQKSDFS